MSMSSRDVLFMMRARDYASREVRNLGGSFGRLQRQIASTNEVLDRRLNASMQRQARAQAEVAARAENVTRGMRAQVGALQAANRIRAEESTILRNTRFERTKLGQAQAKAAKETVRQNTIQNAMARKQIGDINTRIRSVENAAKTEQGAIKRTEETRRQAAQAHARQQHQAIQMQQRKIQQLQAMGIAATVAGAAMLMMGRRGIRALRSMTMEAAAFRYDFARADTQIQDSNNNIQRLAEIARTVGREVPASMDSIGQTMFFIFSSTNATISESQDLLRGFAKEAVAGNSDIESAARSTIAIINGMGLSFEDLTRVQDFQFQTVRRGVITYDQLANNVGKLIPALSRSGQEIETGGAMLAFLTRQGLSAEMATTAAARSLELLADPRVVSRMEAMGVSVRDNVTGEFLPLIDVLTQVNDKFGDMAAPERAEAMLDLFGGAGYRIQARRFFDTVFNNFDAFTWHIEEQLRNAGAMERAYDIMFAEPQVKIQLLKNNVAALRQEFGERLFGVLDTLLFYGLRLVEWFTNLSDGTKDVIAQFALISSIALVLGGGLAVLVGVFTTLVSIVGAFVGVTKAMMLIAGVPALIMAVVGALAFLILNFESIANWLGISNEALFKIVAAFGVFSTVLVVTTVALKTFGVAALGVSGALGAMATAFKVAAAAFFLNPVTILIGALAILAAGILTVIHKSNALSEGAKAVSESMGGVFDSIISGEIALDDYADALDRAGDAVVRQSLHENDLADALRRNGSGVTEYISTLRGSKAERDEYVESLRRQAAEVDKNTGFVRLLFQTKNSEGNILRRAAKEHENYAKELEAGREAAVRAIRDQGRLGDMIGQYVMLTDLGTEASLKGADALKEQIVHTIEGAIAFGDMDENLMALLESEEIAPEIMQEVNNAMQEQVEWAKQMSDSWQALGGIIDNNVGLYREKLNELNEAIEDSDKKHKAHVGLFREALEETTEELRWAVNAQMQLREKYGDDVVNEWSRLYREEPALAKEIHEELLKGETWFTDEMMKQRRLMTQTILSDLERYGFELVDETGRINETVLEIVAQEMGMHPELMRKFLEQSGVVTREGYRRIATDFEEGGRESSRRGARGMAQEAANQLRGIELVGQAWGAAIGTNTNSSLTNNVNLLGALRNAMPSNEALSGLGSRIGGAISGAIQTRINQANITAQARASITRNTGGLIPGRGPDRDSVFAHLTPGEYVLRRRAVDSLGIARLDALNERGSAALASLVGRGGPTLNAPPALPRNAGGPVVSTSSRSEVPEGNTYQYMPGANVIVTEEADVELEIKKFEMWIRSQQP